jgi:hypothetical protein
MYHKQDFGIYVPQNSDPNKKGISQLIGVVNKTGLKPLL